MTKKLPPRVAIIPEMKICRCCCVEKSRTEFGLRKRSRDGLESWCRLCCNEKSRNWYNAHKERKLSQNAEWHKCHLEKAREYVRKSHLKNVEKERVYAKRYCAENRIKRAQSNRLWYLGNKEKAAVLNRRKRAKRAMVLGDGISAEQSFAMKQETGLRCVYCGKKSNQLQVDHVVPVSRHGADDIDNMVPSCKRCNARKGNKPLFFFLLMLHNEPRPGEPA